jgi:hypothetical protein
MTSSILYAETETGSPDIFGNFASCIELLTGEIIARPRGRDHGRDCGRCHGDA